MVMQTLMIQENAREDRLNSLFAFCFQAGKGLGAPAAQNAGGNQLARGIASLRVDNAHNTGSPNPVSHFLNNLSGSLISCQKWCEAFIRSNSASISYPDAGVMQSVTVKVNISIDNVTVIAPSTFNGQLAQFMSTPPTQHLYICSFAVQIWNLKMFKMAKGPPLKPHPKSLQIQHTLILSSLCIRYGTVHIFTIRVYMFCRLRLKHTLATRTWPRFSAKLTLTIRRLSILMNFAKAWNCMDMESNRYVNAVECPTLLPIWFSVLRSGHAEVCQTLIAHSYLRKFASSTTQKWAADMKLYSSKLRYFISQRRKSTLCKCYFVAALRKSEHEHARCSFRKALQYVCAMFCCKR